MGEQLPRNLAVDACAWVRAHRGSFDALVGFLRRQVDEGNPRTTRDDVMAWARRAGVSISVVEELVRDHNLYAYVTRYAVMLEPTIARTVHFKESKADGIDLAAIWHAAVDPETVFLAGSRMEAESMVKPEDAGAA